MIDILTLIAYILVFFVCAYITRWIFRIDHICKRLDEISQNSYSTASANAAKLDATNK